MTFVKFDRWKRAYGHASQPLQGAANLYASTAQSNVRLTAERRRPDVGERVGGVDDTVLPDACAAVLDARLPPASAQLHVVKRAVRR